MGRQTQWADHRVFVDHLRRPTFIKNLPILAFFFKLRFTMLWDVWDALC